MLAITRDVWSGADYLPFVWRSWLTSPNGLAFVAEKGNMVVGLLHVCLQDNDTVWLEGIRVAETERGAGVGSALLSRGLAWASDLGCTVARLSTAGGNEASNRLAEGSGMNLLCTFRALEVAVHPQDDSIFSAMLAGPSHAESIFRHLSDEQLGLPCGMFTEGWTAYSLSLRRIRSLLAGGSRAVVRLGDHIQGAAIVTAGRRMGFARLGGLTGSLAARRELLDFLLARAHSARIGRLRATLSIGDEFLHQMEIEGFRSRSEQCMYLYQKAL